MKYLVSIYLWIMGVIYLILFLLFLILFSFLLPRKAYFFVMQQLAKLFFVLMFIRVKVSGKENMDKDKTYVVMGNHVSMFDIPLMFAYMPFYFQGIEAAEHFKTPIYGWALRRHGNIPINRKNARESMKSILEGVKRIKKGISVVILPEGTRSLQPIMGKFKKFPFVLAQKSGVDILPFAFSGLWKINNKTTWLIQPGKIDLQFGEPIPSELIKDMDLDTLMVKTREEIQALIIRP